MQRMFEKYNFHACAVSIQAMLTLYAQVRFTSLVIDFVVRSASTGLEPAEAREETFYMSTESELILSTAGLADGCGGGHGRWCDARGARVRRLRATTAHPKAGRGRTPHHQVRRLTSRISDPQQPGPGACAAFLSSFLF